MGEFWKFTAWPWLRDKALPGIEMALTGWFLSVEEHPFAHAASVILGAIVVLVVGFFP
jgi:hypothetical protein